jgi:ubiquinone/menaquinone biosynthesis C-methylase UbiE
MLEDKPRKLKDVKKQFDELSSTYDQLGETFESKQEQHFRRKLTREHLPKKKDARILDAGGGTGRTTLPLARMGYQVALYDLSTGMLDVANPQLLEWQRT